MFAPGLITGSLIQRFGTLPIIVTGCLLMLGCTAVALSGIDLMQFLIALTLLGVGWNFMYTGATTLVTGTYRPSEKNKVQGFMDLCVFTTMVTSSASSGAMLLVNGWSLLNLLALPFVVLVLGCILWLAPRIGWASGRVAARAA
jgi:MFS family permease